MSVQTINKMQKVEINTLYEQFIRSLGKVSSKALYQRNFIENASIPWANNIWCRYISSGRSVLLREILHSRLATEQALKLRGFSMRSICRFCCASDENLDHIFWSSNFAQFLWREMLGIFQKPMTAMAGFSNLFSWAMSMKFSSQILVPYYHLCLV